MSHIEYELKTRNNYGNYRIAMFSKLDDLLKYVDDNNPEPKHNYFIIIHKCSMTRYSIESVKEIIKAGNIHLL